MIRLLWVCLTGLFFSSQAFAINALVSHAVFYMPANSKDATLKPYTEIYWQIEPSTLQFSENSRKEWIADIQTDLVLRNDTGILMQKHFVLNTFPATSRDKAIRQNIIDLHRMQLPAGKVYVNLQLTDKANEQNNFVYTDSFTVLPSVTTPFYSNVQLLDTFLTSKNEKSIFYKSGRLQIPLSTNFLDDNRDVLNYYTELYHAGSISSDSLLVQKVFISRKELEMPIPGMLFTDTIRQRENIIPITGSINTLMLGSGNYYLSIMLENRHGERLASGTTFFQRVNTVPVVATLKEEKPDTPVFEKVSIFDLSETFVGKYTLPQLKAILKMIAPISSAMDEETIKGFLKRPDETHMRYFIYNFWTEKNKADPKKAWQEYTNVIKEVNKLFGTGPTPGYETERGQVYLRYGKPEVRITVNNETGALPYEIWQYNATAKQSRPGVFLFYKPGYMISDYKLLHSTVNGEIRNTAWREFLYVSGSQATATNNFRAEEYLK